MRLVRRRFNVAKIGTILFQSICRGHIRRRLLAAVKIQSQVRRRKHSVIYIKLRSAIISLQSIQRRGIAMKALSVLKYDGKDIDKLKLASNVLATQTKLKATRVESNKEALEKRKEMKAYSKKIQVLQEHDKENSKKIGRSEKKESLNEPPHQNTNILTQQSPIVGDCIRGPSFQSHNGVSQDFQGKSKVKIIDMVLPEKIAAERETISIGNDDIKVQLLSDNDAESRMKMPVIHDIENDER
jgi:hypothetical protein